MSIYTAVGLPRCLGERRIPRMNSSGFSWCRNALGWLSLLLAACGGTDAVVQPETEQLTLRSDVEPVRRAEDAMSGVFIPPYTECRDGVCTQVAISGCTEPGRYFPDYGSCDIVRTQRPVWPAPPAREPTSDDPRLSDPEFMKELAWVKEQIEASGCTCCHDNRAPGAVVGQWDIGREGIWLDTLSDPGLALFLGLADSSSLGAYPSQENFGFDRTLTGIPTTDTPRMKAFLKRELDRRGMTEEQARAVPPFGGPIYANRVADPEDCREGGFGIDPDSRVQFGATPARYVYVLADGSGNPGVPPNLDLPDGTIWRLDVQPSAAAVASGLRYGTTPPGSFQAFPERDRAPELERGKRYQLYALRDVGVPVANCYFTFGEPVEPAAAPAPAAGAAAPPPAAGSCEMDGFGAPCSADADCTCRAGYCAKMPGEAQGTCTVSGCKEEPSVCPSGYSCLDLSLFAPSLPSICNQP